MAEDSDDSQKTEDPSGKRLDEAAKQGDVVQSQELKHLIILGTAMMVLITLSGWMADHIAVGARTFLERPHAIPTDGGHLVEVLFAAVMLIVSTLALPVFFLAIAAIAASAVQNPISFNTEVLGFKFERLSPVAGLQRLIGAEGLIELGKGIIKLILIGGAGLLVLYNHWTEIPGFIRLDVAAMLARLLQLSIQVVMAMLIVLAGLAAGDYFLQRFRFFQRHRMTKQEVKDEYKQDQGDPMIKARLRGIRMQRARQRMMQAVPQATVVVTNPTHYAVALRYDEATMAAPVCVAKGVDHMAARIRELAEANGVPLVANPPLARALHASIEIDQPVPPQHFKAVAEVIGFVWRLKGKAQGADVRKAEAP